MKASRQKNHFTALRWSRGSQVHFSATSVPWPFTSATWPFVRAVVLSHVLTTRQFLRVRAFSQPLPNVFGTGVLFKDTSVNAHKSASAWGDVQKRDVLPGEILAEDLRKCEGILTVASKPLLCKFDSPPYCGDSPAFHLLETVERTSQVDAQLINLASTLFF